jgi:hypothetical protein
MEVRPEVEQAFNEWLDNRLINTVWQTGGCRSWYQDPRSGRNTILWPHTTISFWRRTRRAHMSDYHLRTTTDPSNLPPEAFPMGRTYAC